MTTATRMTLAQWRALEPDGYSRPPYDRPCPACGASMTHPTSCRCTFEMRVAALAGDALERDWYFGVRDVNAAMRALDDSSAWPISGRFNVTDRAINRVRRWMRDGGYFDDGLAGYVRAVDHEISRIVNA